MDAEHLFALGALHRAVRGAAVSKKIINCIFAHFPVGQGKLRPLAIALANFGTEDGTRIYPSVATLAACIDQSERTVQGQLRKLQEMGWLHLVRPQQGGGRGGGPGRPREYRISPAWLEQAWERLRKDAELRGVEQPVPWSPRPTRTSAALGSPDSVSPTEQTNANHEEWGARINETPEVAAAPELRTTVEPNTPFRPPLRGEVSRRLSAVGHETQLAFTRLVENYPTKRVDLQRAQKVWRRTDPSLHECIVASVAWLARTPEWQAESGRFAPKLSKWLRNQGWTNPGAQPPVPPLQVAEKKSAGETQEQIAHRRRMAAEVRAAYERGRLRDLQLATSAPASSSQSSPSAAGVDVSRPRPSIWFTRRLHAKALTRDRRVRRSNARRHEHPQ